MNAPEQPQPTPVHPVDSPQVPTVLPMQTPYRKLNAEEIQLITNVVTASVGGKPLSDTEMQFCIQVAERTRLDPFRKQINFIRLKGDTITPYVTIDGLRLLAERTGTYAGQVGPFYCGKDGAWKDVWTENEAPVACKVGVLKTTFRDILWATCNWREYANYNKTGQLVGAWATHPTVMLAKVAEALALRRAFPSETSGLYVEGELDKVAPPVELYPSEKDKQAVRILLDHPAMTEDERTKGYEYLNKCNLQGLKALNARCQIKIDQERKKLVQELTELLKSPDMTAEMLEAAWPDIQQNWWYETSLDGIYHLTMQRLKNPEPATS